VGDLMKTNLVPVATRSMLGVFLFKCLHRVLHLRESPSQYLMNHVLTELVPASATILRMHHKGVIRGSLHRTHSSEASFPGRTQLNSSTLLYRESVKSLTSCMDHSNSSPSSASHPTLRVTMQYLTDEEEPMQYNTLPTIRTCTSAVPSNDCLAQL
jgi:hypothetical protein